MKEKRNVGEKRNAGRPEGAPNRSTRDQIKDAEDRIVKAAYRLALTGDGAAAEFCFAYAAVGHHADFFADSRQRTKVVNKLVKGG